MHSPKYTCLTAYFFLKSQRKDKCTASLTLFGILFQKRKMHIFCIYVYFLYLFVMTRSLNERTQQGRSLRRGWTISTVS